MLHPHPNALAERAAYHASLFADVVASGHVDDRATTLIGLYQAYELHPDYARSFQDALKGQDAKRGGNACRIFDSLFQHLLEEQLQSLSRLAPERFEAEGVEGLARHDANTYATAVEMADCFHLPELWQRVVIGLDHHQYKTALIAQLMVRGISPQRFHKDLADVHTLIQEHTTPEQDSLKRDRVLNSLAQHHAALYINPELRERSGFDHTRMISDVFALKGDPEYWHTLESQILESDPGFGPIHLYWFRQEVAFFEANRKSPVFNDEDLFGFGTLNTALLTLDEDQVLQGGMAGVLRTAHGHSERGTYHDSGLKKASFADALKLIEQTESTH